MVMPIPNNKTLVTKDLVQITVEIDNCFKTVFHIIFDNSVEQRVTNIIIQLLLKYGANINSQDSNGNTLFHHTINYAFNSDRTIV
jgi:transposase